MKIERGWNGGVYVKFRNGEAADKWYWLFRVILRRRYACCDGYFNGFCIINRES